MSILHRPGWANKIIIEARGRPVTPGINSVITDLLDKKSVGNWVFVKNKIVNTLRNNAAFKAHVAAGGYDIDSLDSSKPDVSDFFKQPDTMKFITDAFSSMKENPKLISGSVAVDDATDVVSDTPDETPQDVPTETEEEPSVEVDDEAEVDDEVVVDTDEETEEPESSDVSEISLDEFVEMYGDSIISRPNLSSPDPRSIYTYMGEDENGYHLITVTFKREGVIPPNNILVKQLKSPNVELIGIMVRRKVGGDIIHDVKFDVADDDGDATSVKESTKNSPQKTNQLMREQFIKSQQHKFRMEELHRY